MNIGLVGDIMIGRSFNGLFAQHPNANIWGNTVPVLNSFDLTIGNLETTLTDANTKWPDKAFNYKLSPKYAGILYPFDYVSLANNHILDYMVHGMMDTITTLDDLNIRYAGAGLNLSQAIKPVVLSFGQRRIHLFSAADHYDYWAATDTSPGVFWFDINNPINLLSVIEPYAQKLNSKDTLILSLHWGPNWDRSGARTIGMNMEMPEVSIEKQYLAHQLARMGVNIIHGTSAHHLQQYTIIDDCAIFYSMGDFIDDYAINYEFQSNIGAIASVTIDQDGRIINIQRIPTIIDDMQVNILK